MNDEILELIDRLLSGYEFALENILYKNHNIEQDVKDIDEARDAIQAVLHDSDHLVEERPDRYHDDDPTKRRHYETN